jgi:hypothetical protein
VWRIHLCNLLGSAKGKALNLGGSTLVGVCVAGVLAIIVGFVLTCIIEWYRGGRTMLSIKAALKSWPPYLGAIGGLAAAWMGIYLWSVAAVIYEDHLSLVNQNLKSKAAAADCSSPDPERQITWTQHQRASKRRDAKHETDFVGETQKAIPHGLVVVFTCDHELVAGSADESSEILGATDVGVDQKDRERFVYWFNKRVPIVKRGEPLRVRLWSDAPILCQKSITSKY